MSLLLGSFKDFFTKVNYRKVIVDSLAFRLHYKVTALICLICGIIIAERQYIGDPIDCIIDHKNGDKIIDQFCWVHGTYSQLAISPKGNIGYDKVKTIEDDVAVVRKVQAWKDNGSPHSTLTREFFNYKAGNVDDREFHQYYQWVWWVLIIQAILFYFPHWLWKSWEGGRMKTFVGDLNSYTLSPDDRRKYEAVVCDYFCNCENGQWRVFSYKSKGNHTFYSLKYVFCELLNFSNVVFQLYFMDWFFDYSFSKYGMKLYNLTDLRPYMRNDYLTKVFPIVTMCELPILGYAGEITGHQAMCVLPVNLINEKVFLFLWVWFLIILSLTSVSICYRLFTLLPFSFFRKWLLLRFNHTMCEKSVDKLCRKLGYGDWYFLHLLGKNMNPIYYAELISTLADRIDQGDHADPGNIPTWQLGNKESLMHA